MTKSPYRHTRKRQSASLFVLCATLSCYEAGSAELTTPNTFTAGTPAVADEVNANFSAVETAVNDNDGRITALEVQTAVADVFTLFLPDEVTLSVGDVVGSAELRRTSEGVHLKIDTSELVPGNAYSVWWVIFNNPAACDPAGCGEADLGTPAVEASVSNATGRIADINGVATFSAFLPAGYIQTNPSGGSLRHIFGPGLQELQGAEIQVVVRCHGAATGSVEQLSTFLGDCLTGAGPVGCFDAQAAVFPAAN